MECSKNNGHDFTLKVVQSLASFSCCCCR